MNRSFLLPDDPEDRPEEGYRTPEDGYEDYPPPDMGRYDSPGMGPQQPMRPRPAVRRPVVSYTLLVITAIVFVLQLVSESLTGTDWPALLGMKVNELIVAGQLWRLITPVLLHGGLLHLGFNMYALYILGPGLERYFGHLRFLALSLIHISEPTRPY